VLGEKGLSPVAGILPNDKDDGIYKKRTVVPPAPRAPAKDREKKKH